MERGHRVRSRRPYALQEEDHHPLQYRVGLEVVRGAELFWVSQDFEEVGPFSFFKKNNNNNNLSMTLADRVQVRQGDGP